jgi:hypothetical protein
MLKEVSRLDWQLIDGLVSPAGQLVFRRIRAAVAASTRRESDDDAVLLRIELHRRANPGISIKKAVQDVVISLRAGDKPNSLDVWSVKVGDNRFLEEESAIKHFSQKFRTKEVDIVRRADSQEYGREMARLYGPRDTGSSGGERAARSSSDLVSIAEALPAILHTLIHVLNEFSARYLTDPASPAKVPPDVLKSASRTLDELFPADAGEGFLQNIREFVLRSRSD